MSMVRRVEGSKYLYDSFNAASARMEANERVVELQFQNLELRLDRIEAVMERLEKRLWLAVYGVAAAILAQGARSIMDLQFTPGI